jgi:putative membrane protein
MGLFLLVINAGLVMLAARIVPGFVVESFWWALGFSIVLSIVQGFLQGLDRPRDGGQPA